MTDMTSPAVALAPEDQARADFYALLSHLYADAPSVTLLSQLSEAPRFTPEASEEDESEALLRAWNALLDASALAQQDVDALRTEYTALFLGPGKGVVNLHASFWIDGSTMGKSLVALRDDLTALGLSRDPQASLLEDHLASLCAAMRMLVESFKDENDSQEFDVNDSQKAFFEKNFSPWVFDCCQTIASHPLANYYKKVAQFTQVFLGLESRTFSMFL